MGMHYKSELHVAKENLYHDPEPYVSGLNT